MKCPVIADINSKLRFWVYTKYLGNMMRKGNGRTFLIYDGYRTVNNNSILVLQWGCIYVQSFMLNTTNTAA